MPRWVLFALYTGLLIAVATAAVVRKASDGDTGFFWKAIVIQQCAMAYIYAPFNYWKPPISALLALYFLLELFSWLRGSEEAPAEASDRYPPLIAPKRIRGPCEFALAGAAAAFAYVFAMGTSREPVALPLQQEAAMEQAPPSVTFPEERSPAEEPSPESDSLAARQPSTGPEPPLAAMSPTKKDVYTAVAGDTVKSIAKKLYGKPEKWRAIVKANPGLIGWR